MPRLILLNGAPGSGKSTLAARYVADHPLAANLDVDRIRQLLGGWQNDLTAAGELARAMVLSAARTHLAAGYDVIVPQFLGRVDFIDQLERLAEEAGAMFYEIVLLDTRQNTLARFARRTELAADPAHVEAALLLGGPAELGQMYDRLLDIMAGRSSIRIVPTADGEIDATYRRLLAALA